MADSFNRIIQYRTQVQRRFKTEFDADISPKIDGGGFGSPQTGLKWDFGRKNFGDSSWFGRNNTIGNILTLEDFYRVFGNGFISGNESFDVGLNHALTNDGKDVGLLMTDKGVKIIVDAWFKLRAAKEGNEVHFRLNTTSPEFDASKFKIDTLSNENISLIFRKLGRRKDEDSRILSATTVIPFIYICGVPHQKDFYRDLFSRIAVDAFKDSRDLDEIFNLLSVNDILFKQETGYFIEELAKCTDKTIPVNDYIESIRKFTVKNPNFSIDPNIIQNVLNPVLGRIDLDNLGNLSVSLNLARLDEPNFKRALEHVFDLIPNINQANQFINLVNFIPNANFKANPNHYLTKIASKIDGKILANNLIDSRMGFFNETDKKLTLSTFIAFDEKVIYVDDNEKENIYQHILRTHRAKLDDNLIEYLGREKDARDRQAEQERLQRENKEREDREQREREQKKMEEEARRNAGGNPGQALVGIVDGLPYVITDEHTNVGISNGLPIDRDQMIISGNNSFYGRQIKGKGVTAIADTTAFIAENQDILIPDSDALIEATKVATKSVAIERTISDNSPALSAKDRKYVKNISATTYGLQNEDSLDVDIPLNDSLLKFEVLFGDNNFVDIEKTCDAVLQDNRLDDVKKYCSSFLNLNIFMVNGIDMKSLFLDKAKAKYPKMFEELNKENGIPQHKTGRTIIG